MRGAILLFFLLPIFGFGKNKAITWEKEGVQVYRYFTKETSMLRNLDAEDISDFCTVIYYLAPLNYRKFIDGTAAIEDDDDRGDIYARAMSFAMMVQKKPPSEDFLKKCEKKTLQDIYADLGLS